MILSIVWSYNPKVYKVKVLNLCQWCHDFQTMLLWRMGILLLKIEKCFSPFPTAPSSQREKNPKWKCRNIYILWFFSQRFLDFWYLLSEVRPMADRSREVGATEETWSLPETWPKTGRGWVGETPCSSFPLCLQSPALASLWPNLTRTWEARGTPPTPTGIHLLSNKQSVEERKMNLKAKRARTSMHGIWCNKNSQISCDILKYCHFWVVPSIIP